MGNSAGRHTDAREVGGAALEYRRTIFIKRELEDFHPPRGAVPGASFFSCVPRDRPLPRRPTLPYRFLLVIQDQ